jgi:hypothetical protein
MNFTSGSLTRVAAQVEFARLVHDGFVERLVMPAVALADEDSQ